MAGRLAPVTVPLLTTVAQRVSVFAPSPCQGSGGEVGDGRRDVGIETGDRAGGLGGIPTGQPGLGIGVLKVEIFLTGSDSLDIVFSRGEERRSRGLDGLVAPCERASFRLGSQLRSWASTAREVDW